MGGHYWYISDFGPCTPCTIASDEAVFIAMSGGGVCSRPCGPSAPAQRALRRHLQCAFFYLFCCRGGVSNPPSGLVTAGRTPGPAAPAMAATRGPATVEGWAWKSRCRRWPVRCARSSPAAPTARPRSPPRSDSRRVRRAGSTPGIRSGRCTDPWPPSSAESVRCCYRPCTPWLWPVSTDTRRTVRTRSADCSAPARSSRRRPTEAWNSPSRRCARSSRCTTRVAGDAPDGRHYSAQDPRLLQWVHVG